MNVTSRAKAIAKIKKCLALSSSSNEHEAAAALRQAQKLMAEHKIDQEAIEQAEVAEVGAPAFSQKAPTWEVSLANLVADAFACRMFACKVATQTWIGRGKPGLNYVFVGVGPAGEIAQYAFSVLQRQCVKARAEHIAKQSARCKHSTKTARGDAFAYAWVLGVVPMVRAFAGSANDQELLDRYMTATYPDMGKLKTVRRELSGRVNDDSWSAGHQSGLKAELNRGVGGVKQQPALSDGRA